MYYHYLNHHTEVYGDKLTDPVSKLVIQSGFVLINSCDSTYHSSCEHQGMWLRSETYSRSILRWHGLHVSHTHLTPHPSNESSGDVLTGAIHVVCGPVALTKSWVGIP